jgi:uncharacterized membrane protein
MTEFTHGELKLIFQRIEEKLDDIKDDMKSQHTRYDREIEEIKKEVKDQGTLLVRIATIGGTLWASITLFAGFLLNKFFS